MQDPWLGRRLGNYELEALLGRGGMAAVYRATHVALGTPHAVKVLSPHFAGHPDVKARFLREGRVQAQFHHPGIARVTDTINGEAVGLVMELLEGESLREVLDRGPISLHAAAIIVDDVSTALAYAHERGVVHRDIKPDNIFLAEEEGEALRPVLLDFGVARFQEMTTLTQSGIMIGTPRYMSPEQLEDPRSVDARSDIFSLAVVLFEMLHGQTPHPGETPHAIAMAMMAGRLVRPDASPAPAALREVIERALRPDPPDRFATIEGFADAVADAVGDSTATPQPLPGPLPGRVPDAPLPSHSSIQAPTWPPVPADEVEQILAARTGTAEVRRCRQCGAENPVNRGICRRCRAPL